MFPLFYVPSFVISFIAVSLRGPSPLSTDRRQPPWTAAPLSPSFHCLSSSYCGLAATVEYRCFKISCPHLYHSVLFGLSLLDDFLHESFNCQHNNIIEIKSDLE